MVADTPPPAAVPVPAVLRRTVEGGRSVHGRAIAAVCSGDGARTLLVIGDVHGNETAGRAVVRVLRASRPPAPRVCTVASANPDGEAAGTRQNARGVDLNRNFPARWRGGGRPFDTYFPGPRAASEPETRAVMALVRRLRPAVTIVYHQHMDAVILPRGGDASLARAYARRVGMTTRRLTGLRGTASEWSNRALRGSTSFVVELPAGRLPRGAARRHAAAALLLAAGRHAELEQRVVLARHRDR